MLEKISWLFQRINSGMAVTLLIGGLLVLGANTGWAATSQEELVEEARVTLERFHADPETAWFHEHVQEAKAVFVIPGYYAGAAIIGAGGGNGVFMVQNQHSHEWSQPAFYTVANLGFGLQLGFHVMETAIMVMTREGMDAFNKTRFKIGGGASVTLGPKGGGHAATPSGDLITFSLTKGAWVGVSLGGATIAVHEDYNEAYYGEGVTPKDILKGKVSNPQSEGLRAAITKVGYQPTLKFFPVK